MSYMKQTKKRKQALETAQYGPEITLHKSVCHAQFPVVYHGMFHQPLEFSRYTHESFYDSFDNTFSATHHRKIGCKMIPLNLQRLFWILIGRIFYGVV